MIYGFVSTIFIDFFQNRKKFASKIMPTKIFSAQTASTIDFDSNPDQLIKS